MRFRRFQSAFDLIAKRHCDGQTNKDLSDATMRLLFAPIKPYFTTSHFTQIGSLAHCFAMSYRPLVNYLVCL